MLSHSHAKGWSWRSFLMALCLGWYTQLRLNIHRQHTEINLVSVSAFSECIFIHIQQPSLIDDANTWTHSTTHGEGASGRSIGNRLPLIYACPFLSWSHWWGIWKGRWCCWVVLMPAMPLSIMTVSESAFRGLVQRGQEVGLGDKMPKTCPVVLHGLLKECWTVGRLLPAASLFAQKPE